MLTLRPAVRAGLRRLVAQPGAWPPADPFIFQNLLLDECSSDARPLVRLVLRAGEIGIPDRIARARQGATPWEQARAPMVLALVEELFVQSEVAQWVVDTWAIALGAVAEQRPAPAPPPAPRRAAPPPPRPRAPVPVPATRPMRPAVQVLPTPPAPARSRPPMAGSASAPSILRNPVIWGALVLAFTVMGAVAWNVAQRPRDTRGGIDPNSPSGAMLGAAAAAPSAPAAAAPPGVQGAPDRPPATASSQGVASLTPSALPGPGADLRRVQTVNPATRPNMPAGPGATAIVAREVGADGIPGSPTALPRNASPAERKPDRVELRAGRVLTGRVELVRPSVIIFQEWESGLRFELAKSDIASITTEFGTTVRFSAEGTPANERRVPLVRQGVGGEYLASYRITSISGSTECRTIWPTQPAAERVQVTHTPGADTLTMVFASGKRFATVIDGVGQFATSFAIAEGQARTATALTTRLEGRFGSQGFDGTTHVIAFRRAAGGGDLSCYAQIQTVAIKQR